MTLFDFLFRLKKQNSFLLLTTLLTTLLISCGNKAATQVYFINIAPDSPVEITTAVQKELCIDDYFVLLDNNDKIVSSKQRGLAELDSDSKNIYFKLYDAQNEDLGSLSANYRLDISFKYDTLGSLDKLFLKTQKYEHSFWHAYADAGSFDLMLDAKQSRLKPKQQTKIVLEKIVSTIKKTAFK
jgi:hypothetical protein